MRQGNGTDLLGMNDPRSATIGVIYVSPVDDRKSVLAAILTQENLNRQHIVVVLPNPNSAFQAQQDFDDLKSVQRKRKLQGEIIFVAPDGPGPSEFARQRRFPVYDTLEEYTEALRDGEADDLPDAEPEPVPEKKNRFFGGWMKTAGVGAAAGAAAGAVAAHQEQPDDEPQSTMIFPSNKANQQPDMSPRQSPVPSTPRIPNTPGRSTLDDDDDLGDEPFTPPTGRSGITGGSALGAGSEHLRRSPMIGQTSGNLDDEDNDVVEKIPSRGLPADNAMRSPRASNPLAQNPNTAQNNNPGPGGPGIIDLQPLTPKSGGRIPGSTGTGKLNEPPVSVSTPIPDLDEDENFAPLPPTHGAKRRRTGSMATGAAAAGATGAFVAIGAPNSGSHATAAGNTNSGSVTPIQYPPSRGVPPQRPNRTGQRRRRGGFFYFAMFILLVVLLLLLATGLYIFINPAGFQTNIVRPISGIMPGGAQASPVTVAIIPKSQVVSDTYVIQAVTSSPNADLQQVSLKNLTSTPAPQTKTVTGTGHTQTNPTQATGTVTFFNPQSTSVTVAATTFAQLPNGVIIVTNSSVTVPSASFVSGQLVNGQKSVAAHAKNTGTIGNIASGALIVNNCCQAGLRAQNTIAFTGGQNAQDYTFIQQSDVNAVVNPLVNTLAQEAKTQFNQQLTSNESLVESPSCPDPKVDDDPGAIGDRGHTIPSMTVTVTATCTGIAYDRSGAQKVAQQRLQKKAITTPGKGYVLTGPITSKIINVSKQTDSASLQVQAQGTWNYQVTDAQKATLTKELAGMKMADAQAFLNTQPGFQKASIQSNGSDTTLPKDTTQIKIDVQPVSGSNNATPGDSTPTPSGTSATTQTSTDGRGTVPTETSKG